MTAVFKKFLLEESGQGLLEYSLILFFIAIAAIVVLQTLGYTVTDLYSYVMDEWPD